MLLMIGLLVVFVTTLMLYQLGLAINRAHKADLLEQWLVNSLRQRGDVDGHDE